MLGRRARIEIKTAAQLHHMRAAGLVVADALAATAAAVAPGVTTGELDSIAARVIADAGARSNFKGYHGFPGVICTSVNDEVVHGIPGDRVLREGDLISIDCGAIVEGWHGDAAVTVPVGAPSWLSRQSWVSQQRDSVTAPASSLMARREPSAVTWITPLRTSADSSPLERRSRVVLPARVE